MSLTIVTGPAQAGKTQACIKALSGTAQPEIILLCATTYLSDSLGRRLALRRLQDDHILSSQSHITTMTFHDLTEKLWGLKGDERALIGQAARETVISELLEDLPRTSHSESLFTAGGRRFLSDVVQTFAGGPQIPGALSFAVPRVLRDLGQDYRRSLQERGLIEHDAALFDLASRGCFIEAAYGLLGFTDFPPPQRAYGEMLMMCSDVAIAVTSELTGDASEEGRRFAVELAEDYRRRTGEEPVLLQEAAPPGDGPAAELSELRRDFLQAEDFIAGDPAPGENTGEHTGAAVHLAVSMIPARGEDEEILSAAQAAQTAIDAIAQQRNKADITTDDAPAALIFRQLGTKALRLAQALDFLGVPADFDLTVPFEQTGLGAALARLLHLPFSDDPLTLAADHLLSSYGGVPQAEAYFQEKRLREQQMDYARIRQEGVVPDASSLTAKGWAQLATNMLLRAAAIPRSEFLDQGDFAAHKAFLAVLDELRTLEQIPGLHSSASDATSLDPGKLLTSIADLKVKLTPAPGSTRLLVSEASRARGRQFHTVILAGLAQQDFMMVTEPSLKERMIARITGRREPDKIVGEHQLWYDLLGCARQSLILIGQNYDLSGKELAPSGFLEEILALCGQKGEWEQAALPHSLHDELTLLQTHTESGSQKAQAFLACDASQAPSCPPRGRLTGLDFSAHAAAPFAITTLETYAKCHYAWFLSDFVARCSITENTDALTEGNIIHKTLQYFYERARDTLGCPRVTTENQRAAARLLDACFDEAATQVLKLRSGDLRTSLPMNTQASLDVLQDALHTFLESEAAWLPGFTPTHFEWKFGAEGAGEAPAPIIGGVALRGSIDRIDTLEPAQSAKGAKKTEAQLEGEGGGESEKEDETRPEPEDRGLLFVVDYKRNGAKDGGSLKTRAKHRELQATVYGLVAEQMLRPLRYAGSTYRNILNPADLSKTEHRKSIRERYAEELGFPATWNKKPQAIRDEDPEDGGLSEYDQGLADIEALVADAARNISCGDASITGVGADPSRTAACLFARRCLFIGCPYYQRGHWS
ncbi:MAG: PD-(D/E)XK nuclease family protein [Coriobacteriia bacterium]|nr:PD-(D/E)XK nuclease family protein [Coriobacteriia bacterium]